ncbi:hypothetical protein [Gilliamella apicola]|uniref:hypothetical protein n=1 Tax=Gilliamella apicola TaxID=1196095 RepID=UPI001EE63900|nr:hypothetical protein [Gilliamella apicola]
MSIKLPIYNGTGILVMKKHTPVIDALFGLYLLKKTQNTKITLISPNIHSIPILLGIQSSDVYIRSSKRAAALNHLILIL